MFEFLFRKRVNVRLERRNVGNLALGVASIMLFTTLSSLSISFILAVFVPDLLLMIEGSTELLLLILLFDWRYLPLLLFLAPTLTETAIQNIVAMWDVPKSYGNFFINLIKFHFTIQ